HIVPWNYPLQMTGRSVAPSLAMGNSIVLKPAEDTSLTALALARLAEEAGFPAGVFNVVTGLGEEAGAALTAHPGIGHVSFTGSREVGVLVQTAAAKNTIPVTLELGGKSPQVVFADADFAAAGTTIVRGITQNAGQTCSAGSRVLIEDSVYDKFTGVLAEGFRALRVGSGSQDLDLGPVVNATQKARIERYLDIARRDNLPILAEGSFGTNVPEGGYYVKPTLIGDVPPDHVLAQEEIFGPVLVAIPWKTVDEVVAMANDSHYGLAAFVWSHNLDNALNTAHRLEAGWVQVNQGGGQVAGQSYGGYKQSGLGREVSLEGMLEGFTQIKQINVKLQA
ncbi:MAG: aldehyde dehydrogenase family protein, partial [Salinibacterium sp.]|nr:aldehyde dehydrogenase family protein [Salinibacterium sp.]